MSRLTIVPDERFQPLSHALKALLASIPEDLNADNLGETAGEQLFDFLRSYNLPEPDQEIVVWAKADRSYEAIWSSMDPEDEVVGMVTADLSEGLVSRVFQSGHSALQIRDEADSSSWTNLEARRGRKARVFFASPITFFDKVIAVITLCDYRAESRTSDEDFAVAARLAESAGIFDTLIENHFIRTYLGLPA